MKNRDLTVCPTTTDPGILDSAVLATDDEALPGSLLDGLMTACLSVLHRSDGTN